MFPLLAYTSLAALGLLVVQAIQPDDVLRNPHHRKLYWTGAFASLGLVGAVGAILAA